MIQISWRSKLKLGTLNFKTFKIGGRVEGVLQARYLSLFIKICPRQNNFCPRQNIFVPDKKFCPKLKSTFLLVKWMENNFLALLENVDLCFSASSSMSSNSWLYDSFEFEKYLSLNCWKMLMCVSVRLAVWVVGVLALTIFGNF